MKMHPWILTVLAACAVTLASCNNSGGVDTSALKQSFSTAEASLKSAADTAVTAIQKADYSGATSDLQKLAGNAKLTDAQKKAISDTLDQIKKVMADMASKASGDASKALGGLPKTN